MKRFRRAEIIKGETKSYCDMGFVKMPSCSISYLCREACQADARAFSNLMAHIREVDEKEGTVIGIQVENETGLSGSAREHSDEADRFLPVRFRRNSSII